jgi:hypothetical protein
VVFDALAMVRCCSRRQEQRPFPLPPMSPSRSLRRSVRSINVRLCATNSGTNDSDDFG